MVSIAATGFRMFLPVKGRSKCLDPVSVTLFIIATLELNALRNVIVNVNCNEEALKRHDDRSHTIDNVCGVMQVFIVNAEKISLQENDAMCIPSNERKKQKSDLKANINSRNKNLTTIAIFAMLTLLVVSCITAVMDVVKNKTKQESKIDALRRCSLADFANKKLTRRESTVGEVIASELASAGEDSAISRRARFYRLYSVGSAIGKIKRESMSTLNSGGIETPATPPILLRTPLRLLGARPPPLLRRSSFPASLLLEGAHLKSRRGSVDSEGESSPEIGHRRVRIIRRR